MQRFIIEEKQIVFADDSRLITVPEELKNERNTSNSTISCMVIEELLNVENILFKLQSSTVKQYPKT